MRSIFSIFPFINNATTDLYTYILRILNGALCLFCVRKTLFDKRWLKLGNDHTRFCKYISLIKRCLIIIATIDNNGVFEKKCETVFVLGSVAAINVGTCTYRSEFSFYSSTYDYRRYNRQLLIVRIISVRYNMASKNTA